MSERTGKLSSITPSARAIVTNLSSKSPRIKNTLSLAMLRSFGLVEEACAFVLPLRSDPILTPGGQLDYQSELGPSRKLTSSVRRIWT
jgi:hypothetical protein